MEWTESLKKAIRYMEDHLFEEISTEDVAAQVYMSAFYFQKGFKLMTGYSLVEYMKNRRLYLAGLDVIKGKEKVIDLAYKCGYETPESFTKAFIRFHGVSPLQLRNTPWKIQTFLPLKVKVIVQGGIDMNYVIEPMEKFQVIGFEKVFHFEKAYEEIPKFWDEFCTKYMDEIKEQKGPKGEVQEAICKYCIGEYGVNIDDIGANGEFRYIIAGPYHGGEVPEGMTVYTFPELTWAKFSCLGPMPEALQNVNSKIFHEWLPNNEEYEITMGANIEWYPTQDTEAQDYESAIWIPVKKKD